MAECKKRLDWNKWKEAIETELNSLKKRKVFNEVIPTPPITFLLSSSGFSFEIKIKIMRW
jgi:hypothetical protein